MDSRVLPSKDISGILAESFVCLKVDVDNPSAVVAKLLAQVQGNTLPFYAYVSPEGKFLTGTSGFRDVDDFKGDLEGALRNYKPKPPADAEKKAESPKDSSEPTHLAGPRKMVPSPS